MLPDSIVKAEDFAVHNSYRMNVPFTFWLKKLTMLEDFLQKDFRKSMGIVYE